MFNSTDILAKLLANENLAVIRDKVSTASFNIKERVLTLPLWKFSDQVVEEMLVLHEIGHALYTTKTYVDFLTEEGHLMHYMNVIEDVRIEKKVKERYPGAKKSFYNGYKILNENDFFGIAGKPQDYFDDLSLIDKINLYYKVGNEVVDLSDAEKKIIELAYACETERDVYHLAKRIYELDSQEKQGKNLNLDDGDLGEDDGDEGMPSGSIEDYQQEEESRDDKSDLSSAGGGSSNNRSPLKSKTYEHFEKKVKDATDTSTHVAYYVPKFQCEGRESVFVSYKDIMKVLGENSTETKISPSTNKIVSNLVKEFEMKKSAESLKFSSVSKTGQIDPIKLFSYKTKDDIFKKITKVKDSKKHGMLLLLDWSGSMSKYMSQTIDQVVNLALFCKRAGIPFQVLAFSNYYRYDGESIDYLKQHRVVEPNGFGRPSSMNLLEFFSSEMTQNEIETMYGHLYNHHYLPRKLHLGGTPLNEALIYMVDYIGEFINKFHVEKMTFMTLTDGESGKIEHANPNPYGKTISIMKDPVSRREYEFKRVSTSITETLLKVINGRYPTINNVGFFVTSTGSGYTGSSIRHFCTHHYQRELVDAKCIELKDSLRVKGYHEEKNLCARKVYYVLNSRDMLLNDNEIENFEEGTTSSKIAKSFMKAMDNSRASRIVLNKFVTLIA